MSTIFRLWPAWLGLLVIILLMVNRQPANLPSLITRPPSLPQVSNQPLQLISWIPYWDQDQALKSFSQNITQFDYLGLFWYRLDQNGQLTTYRQTKEDPQITNLAHQNNVKVLALVANLPDFEKGGDWDYRRVDRVISSPQTREKHIADLVGLTTDKNFDGINIDYEALKKSQREDFSLFIEELAQALHQQGKILGVSIHPKTAEDNPAEDNGSHAQDLARISQATDQLYFMTYDEHNEKTEPGPIGPLDWSQRVINYALSQGVANQKIFFGIPLYGYAWTTGEGRPRRAVGMEYQEVTELISRFDPEVNWDGKTGESSFSYTDRGRNQTVWFNGSRSVEAKLKLAKKLGVGGIALWRLGREDPGIWEAVRKYK